MDNADQNASEVESEAKPDAQVEPQVEPQYESIPVPESKPQRVTRSANRRVKKNSFWQALFWRKRGKEAFQHSPRLPKPTPQGKFMPTFWTVATILSLLVNIVLIAVLISFGHQFSELKKVVSNGLVDGLYNNLTLMDQAHIVTTVPVQTDVRFKHDLPVSFDLPIKQDSQVTLTRSTTVAATTIINGSLVPLNVTLPASTPLQFTFNTTVPISTTAPLDLTIPVSLQVPMDVAIDQTDLHQSIIGMQGALEPYITVSPNVSVKVDTAFCKFWLSGWMCNVVGGK